MQIFNDESSEPGFLIVLAAGLSFVNVWIIGLQRIFTQLLISLCSSSSVDVPSGKSQHFQIIFTRIPLCFLILEIASGFHAFCSGHFYFFLVSFIPHLFLRTPSVCQAIRRQLEKKGDENKQIETPTPSPAKNHSGTRYKWLKIKRLKERNRSTRLLL